MVRLCLFVFPEAISHAALKSGGLCIYTEMEAIAGKDV